MMPQEAAEMLAGLLNQWERESGYVLIADGQDAIVATISPEGGWRYAAHVEPDVDEGWHVA